MQAQAARLEDRAVVHVGGSEARPFLNRLLTQEVETLGAGELRYAALLTPQGRVLHDLFLWGEADAVRIDVHADARDDLVRRLAMFRLRAAVEIVAEDVAVHALWGVASPPDVAWRPDPRRPELGFRTLGASPAGIASGDYRAHRYALGVPEAVADGLSDKAYATEADLDLLNGVDFAKGCFVGQETTSRMKRRGGVRSRVVPLALDGAAARAGAEVLAGDLRAGEVLAACGDRALALLRLDRLDAAPLSVDGRVVRAAPPGWMTLA